jgi:hypothetical protein
MYYWLRLRREQVWTNGLGWKLSQIFRLRRKQVWTNGLGCNLPQISRLRREQVWTNGLGCNLPQISRLRREQVWTNGLGWKLQQIFRLRREQVWTNGLGWKLPQISRSRERRKRIRKVRKDRKHEFEAEDQTTTGFKMEIHWIKSSANNTIASCQIDNAVNNPRGLLSEGSTHSWYCRFCDFPQRLYATYRIVQSNMPR